jgi:hypothetical protein
MDGDVYAGQWEDDKASGFGKYSHFLGVEYEGQWVSDLQHGNGREICKYIYICIILGPDKSNYVGEYFRGLK